MNIEIVPYDLVAESGNNSTQKHIIGNNQLLEDTIKSVHGVIVPGGFGERAWEDKIYAT